MGLVCAVTFAVIAGGFRMAWGPFLGEAKPIFLRNHPSAFEEAVFVTAAVAAGVANSTMRARAFPRDILSIILEFILPREAAFKCADKRRLMCNGCHVNWNLRKRKFRMETPGPATRGQLTVRAQPELRHCRHFFLPPPY